MMHNSNRQYYGLPQFTVRPVRPITPYSSQSTVFTSLDMGSKTPRPRTKTMVNIVPKTTVRYPASSPTPGPSTPTVTMRYPRQVHPRTTQSGMRYQMIPSPRPGVFIRTILPARLPVRTISTTWVSPSSSKQKVIPRPRSLCTLDDKKRNDSSTLE